MVSRTGPANAASTRSARSCSRRQPPTGCRLSWTIARSTALSSASRWRSASGLRSDMASRVSVPVLSKRILRTWSSFPKARHRG